jgi:ketosteroid isomerase-like protein
VPAILGLVSRENVELHRRLVAAFNTRDLEAFIAGFDQQIEFHSRFAAVGGVTAYRGHAGLRTWNQDVEEVWGEEFRLEVEAYFDLGERTLAFGVLHGRGRQSGVVTTMPVAHVMRWRDGLCVFWQTYLDRQGALAELGVSRNELKRIDP